MTPKQYQTLSEKARACGLCRRAFLIRLIEGNIPIARPSEEIRVLRTEIHHIGNNINQIARSANAGIATAEDARYAVRLLEKVYGLLYEIMKR